MLNVFQGKLLSVKVDIATRNGVSFLGVNIQFIKNNKIKIRTLGVIELKEKHSASYLEQEFKSIFELYMIPVENLYTFTSDNGTNMLKLSKLLKDLQETKFLELEDDKLDENQGAMETNVVRDTEEISMEVDSDTEVEEESQKSNDNICTEKNCGDEETTYEAEKQIEKSLSECGIFQSALQLSGIRCAYYAVGSRRCVKKYSNSKINWKSSFSSQIFSQNICD